jgi:predicted Ser/Thr protein kinase
MGWFRKEEKKDASPQVKEESSILEFQDVLDKSLTEETKSKKDKKENSRTKSMVKLLLDHGYSIDEINALVKAGRRYRVESGEIIEK